MLLQVASVFLACLLQICCCQNEYNQKFTDDPFEETFGRVVFTSMLFRHGDRTVRLPYPTDPYPMSFWKEGSGQLTNIGKLHEYQLGQWTRQRYNDLVIGKPYRYDFLVVNSSDVDRTIMSADLFLAGFYPPSGEEMWNQVGLRWQPIPVHSIPRNIDNVIGLDKPCEKYDLELDILNNSPEFDAYFEENRKLFEYVSTRSGLKLSKDDIIAAFGDLLDVYDDLFIEAQNNLTLPTWTDKIYPEPLKSVAEFDFSITAYTREMQRLKGGPLLKSIISDMINKRDNSSWNRTFHFYSGHDTTVAVLLDTLGVYNRIAPPYSSAVIVELREKDGDHFVAVFYRNSSETAPFLLKIPGCKKEACLLDEFIKTTASVIPEDWDYECELGFLMKLYYFTYFDLMVLGFIVLILITLLVIIGKLHCTRIRRYKHYQRIQDNVLNPDAGKSV